MGGGQEKGKERTNSALPFLFLPFAEILAIRMLPAAGRGPVSARCHLLGGGTLKPKCGGQGKDSKESGARRPMEPREKQEGRGAKCLNYFIILVLSDLSFSASSSLW